MASFVLGAAAGGGSGGGDKSVDTDHLEHLQMKMNPGNQHLPLQGHSSLPPTPHELYNPQPSPAVQRPPKFKELNNKRHYKKDSRYVLDLYTLTFDENETVDEIEPCKTAPIVGPSANGAGAAGDNEFFSLAPSTISTLDSQPGSGPMSLGSNYSATTTQVMMLRPC